MSATLGQRRGWAAVLLIAAACSPQPVTQRMPAVTAETHAWFPVAGGAAHELGRATVEGPFACESCHPPAAESFSELTCVGCHEHQQPVVDLLHSSVADYRYESAACFSCHPASEKVAFDHAGSSASCAICHDEGAPYAALPRDGFNHPAPRGAECSACHAVTAWKGANGLPPGMAGDPNADVVVQALIPSYAGTSIARLTPQTQSLRMSMNHASTAVPAVVASACVNCHPIADSGAYYPGRLHASLDELTLPQPDTCGACHSNAAPTGFVGPTATNPARTPPSGEMKHDAVLWANGSPTQTSAVPGECGVCHGNASWATDKAGQAPARFHAALSAAGSAQPSSCVDCHANSRPERVLTSANSALPASIEFDHAAEAAKADCAGCHAGSVSGVAWTSGRFHLEGSGNPATCLPCHAAARPTSTAGWTSATYQNAPFDYVTNPAGVTHGAGQDCAVCHPGPGTGAWGRNPNWVGGHFTHGPSTLSGTGCIACHSTQRPDLQPGTTAAAMATLLGFDHSKNGAGECFGCHQATVTAGSYVHYYAPGTSALPGGDWKGGLAYPGSSFASSMNQFVTVTTTKLNRSGTFNLVTSTSSGATTLYNGMQHVSPALPPELNAGPTGAPDWSKCWHCHTHSAGTVTSYNDGQYHAALTTYAATPGGTVTPLAQPTGSCASCHAQTRPPGIVARAGSTLEAMDHSVELEQAVTIGGLPVTRVSEIDCSVCHRLPGDRWSDGVFHARVGSAEPKSCVGCHYTLMADAAKADVTSGTRFAMKHRSSQLTTQECDRCHPTALSNAASSPVAAASWRTGALHPSVTAQPTACGDCHGPSDPVTSTQSSWVYTLPLGGTATNGGQWMNHASAAVAGKDCAVCHAADARQSGSAWSKATMLHAAVPSPGSCQECHGLTNGNGAVLGARNNLPAGLTNSTKVTSASSASGVPAGTLDQITHADVNARGDCKLCHTQAGRSTAAGVQGKEWAQASFHSRFTGSLSLTMNGSTGRCSNCHLNVKPTGAYAGQDHGSFTATAGTTDCSSCHAWPGTGSAASPNWLGVSGGMPQYISVGGFTVPRPPAANTTTIQQGINNLPHPAVGSGVACTACHASSTGGKRAHGYDHASSLINTNCSACHEAGSDLVATPWNGATTASGGAGDTRPFTLVGLVPSFKGNTKALTNGYQHFFGIGCHECHQKPTGTVTASTGSTYQYRWRFIHHTGLPMLKPATCDKCHAAPNTISK